MDNKVAVQRVFRGILLRKAVANEEKLFADYLDKRDLSADQLTVLGWQSTEFKEKVAPIALLDFALSGEIDGQRVIGWFNSPGGAPLAPGTTTKDAIDVMLSGYGVSSLTTPSALAARLITIANGLQISLSGADASALAEGAIANDNLAELLYGAINAIIATNPQWVYAMGAGLMESVLSETVTMPTHPGPPIADAISILDAYLAPSFTFDFDANESSSNDGSIVNPNISLTGAAWRGRVGERVAASFSGVPSGLTAKVVITGAQTAEVQFSGKARIHDEAASKDIVIKFVDTNFNGSKVADIEPLVKGEITLPIVFRDNYPWSITGATLEIFGKQSVLNINLDSQIGLVGKFEIPSLSAAHTDTLIGITTVDARAVTGVPVTLTGGSDADTLYANDLGSTLRGGKGDDILYLGKGIDTIMFEAVSESGTADIDGNGLDKIHKFKVGAGGDVLDFTEFLSIPAFMSAGSPILGSSVLPVSWTGVPGNTENIFVILEDGVALNTPAAIAGLFGAAKPLAAPSTPAELVLVIGSVFVPGNPGGLSIWYVGNRSAGGSTTVIEPDEVVQVAELVGVNSLIINALVPENFVLGA